MDRESMIFNDLPVTIQFIHEAPTPHNNYLLDEIARRSNVTLYRHYILTPEKVPGRPWKTMGAGNIQSERIRTGYNRYFDWSLIKLALLDNRSVFFVIGWESPILVILLFIIGIRKRPLLIWDDGQDPKSLHLLKKWWHPKQAIKRLLVKLINRAPGTYFHTGKVKISNILELGISKEKLENLPFFVKPGVYTPSLRDRHNCDISCSFILAGGRLIQEKGYDVFISALCILKNNITMGWRAVIIGSGPEEQRLRELTKLFGLDDYLDFVNWAEPELFANYIHSCDIFVAPARFDRFPTTVIAAMQAGISVVATDKVGSAIEFIESGKNGVIVSAEQPEALANAMKQLLLDKNLRKALGYAAKIKIQQWPVERGAQIVVDAAKKAWLLCAE